MKPPVGDIYLESTWIFRLDTHWSRIKRAGDELSMARIDHNEVRVHTSQEATQRLATSESIRRWKALDQNRNQGSKRYDMMHSQNAVYVLGDDLKDMQF